MPLTDAQVRNARSSPDGTGNRLTDSGRMSLQLDIRREILANALRFAGKDKTLALGVYPDVSLAAARKKREQVLSVSARVSTLKSRPLENLTRFRQSAQRRGPDSEVKPWPDIDVRLQRLTNPQKRAMSKLASTTCQR